MACCSRTKATMLMLPPQRGQRSGSTSKMRRRSSAQRRRRAWISGQLGVSSCDASSVRMRVSSNERLTEAFRRALLRAFVRAELLTRDQATSMLDWPHSGFHVHHAVRLEADDACGILQLARYAARAPVSLQRMHYDARKRTVRIVSDKSEGPTAGAHDFDALEFLARLLTHVPDHHEICVRYYGAYSVRRRARWRKRGILDDTRMRTDDASQDDTPSWPEIQARRRRWAELLQRVFEVDPLRCPRCGGNMRIVAFVLEQHAIDAILKHLRRTRHDPARLTEHDDLLARPPP